VLVHLLAFAREVLLFERPGVHHGIFRIPAENVPATRLWSFDVGFDNLFLAAGPVLGLVLLHTGNPLAAAKKPRSRGRRRRRLPPRGPP
jgi:putative membrane protein